MSEQSLESNREPDESVHPGPLQRRHKSPAHSRPGTCASYSAQIVYRANQFERGRREMNRVPAIVWNHPEEREQEEIDPADLAPLVSGNSPIVTVPEDTVEEDAAGRHDEVDEDEELRDIVETAERLDAEFQEIRREFRNLCTSTPEITQSQQQAVVPKVDVLDVDKAWESEYSQHPDPNITEISDRLSNQVWDLLQIIQERVDQQTYNSKDIEIADGLNAISVMIHRISDISLNADKVSTGKP